MQLDAQRHKLLSTLAEVWKREGESVRRFGLSYDPSGIREAYGGWIVPVWPAVESGSAHELVRVFERLSELTEAETDLSVNIMLDPARIGLPQANGNNGPHGPKR